MDPNMSPEYHNRQAYSQLLQKAKSPTCVFEPEVHSSNGNGASANVWNTSEGDFSPQTENSTSWVVPSFSSILGDHFLHSYSDPMEDSTAGQVEQNLSDTQSSSGCAPAWKRVCQRGLQSDHLSGMGLHEDNLNFLLNHFELEPQMFPQIFPQIFYHTESESAEVPDQTGYSLPEMPCNDQAASSVMASKSKIGAFGGTSLSIYPEGQGQAVITRNEEAGSSATKYNKGNNSTAGGHPPLGRRLLVQKFLTSSDIGTNIPGILLPKGTTTAILPNPGAEGLQMRMHDGEEKGKSWIMRLTEVNHSSGKVYRLKESLKYIIHHALREKDLLQIIWEKPDAGEECEGLYTLKFKRCLPEYIPLFSDTHTGGRTWKLIFQKILAANDVEVGPQSVGSICLGKNEAEKHFPRLPQGGEGVEMTLYDWQWERTWKVKLKRSFHKKCDVYRLQNMAEFLISYAVEEGDLFFILRSDEPNDVRYAVHTSKP